MIVFYCRPFTCDVLALDVAAEHESTLIERRRYGGFSPRHLWANRSELFRNATKTEEANLRTLGCHGFNVHEWIVTNNPVTEVHES